MALDGGSWRPRKRHGIALAALVLLAIGGAGIILIAFGESNDQHPGWRSYRNGEQSYRIEYPVGWELKEEPTRCDQTGFCVQSIELKRGEDASVYVFVNFQGGWCEDLPAPTVADIEVSGYAGKEYRCPSFTIRSFGPGASIIRYFPGAKGKINYVVMGQSRSDLSEVEAVVKTFRFTD